MKEREKNRTKEKIISGKNENILRKKMNKRKR